MGLRVGWVRKFKKKMKKSIKNCNQKKSVHH